MNEIGRRAGVAKRTLYNAFQTREQMVAMAIREYFEDFVQHIPFENPPGTLMRNVERMMVVLNRNKKIRNYIRAIMSLYFSPQGDVDIWSIMHVMALHQNLEYIRVLHAKRQLQPWVDVDQLAADVVRFEYATINDWAHGRIPDEDAVRRLLECYLTLMAGATRGTARKEIETLLLRLHQEGMAALPQMKRIPVPTATPIRVPEKG
ncbi:TetR/AcrR family transcriptional regulator [Sandaracinobacter sp. RS1-74]|nr:TetR/AcrR family transcriptional regulator [Sandaracinobacteroides sayramensis]